MSDPTHTGATDWNAMLHGFVDGELDSIHSAEFEAHLATCSQCQAEMERVTATRAVLAGPDVKWRTPENIRTRVISAVSREQSSASEPVWRRIARLLGQWSLAPSLAALAAALFLFFNAPVVDLTLQDQIVASHVRSLLADHLADVKTSNQHTVKPWFNGKIDFAPPVVELADKGFPLVGGRVDYLDGKVVAALVYRHGGHVINLFIWPRAAQRDSDAAHEGYNIREWSAGGLAYWAISDIDAGELVDFSRAFIAAAAREAEKMPVSQ